MLLDGCQDFISGDEVTLQAYFDEKIDIHHIFPKKFCIGKGIDQKQYDCIINKTAISSKSNKVIGGNAPSDYLEKIKRKADIPRVQLQDYLESHAINIKTLESNDFDAFFCHREAELLDRIERAMGKKVEREKTADEYDFDDQEDSDYENDYENAQLYR